MLKVLAPADIDLRNLRSKCGEIHYQKSRWNFLCIFCGLNSECYNEFRDHFESEHLREFLETVSHSLSNPTDLPFFEEETLATAHLIKAKTNDPLKLTESTSPLKEGYDSNNSEDFENFENNAYRSEMKELEASNSFLANSKIKFHENTGNRKTSGSETCDDLEAESLSNNESNIDWKIPFQPGFLKNSQKRPYKPRNKACICTYCGRSFRRRYQLDTHVNIHTGAKPHQCEICGRQFRAVTTLQRHLNTHEKRNFSCSFCEKSFTHKVALLSHESRHTQERKESCDLCEKQFYTVNQLDTHKRRVHKKSNDVLPFACDLCPNRYRSMSMLSTHKCRKHYKTAKFQCEKCDKKFIDSLSLDEHQKIHVDGNVSLHT